MLKPLNREYWPQGAGRPIVRVLLGMLGGPLIVVLLLLQVLVLADYLLYGNVDGTVQKFLEFGPVALVLTYTVSLTLGLIAFLLLWALRLRGRLAFWIAGLVVGGAAAFLFPLLSGPPATLVTILPLVFYFGFVLLAIRWVAGVRMTEQ